MRRKTRVQKRSTTHFAKSGRRPRRDLRKKKTTTTTTMMTRSQARRTRKMIEKSWLLIASIIEKR